MVELSDIYKEIDERDIDLIAKKIGLKIACSDAVTIKFKDGTYSILINIGNMASIAQIKSVLMHELGHCATGCTHHVDSPLDLVCQHEHKANKWASERFLPFSELQEAMKNGCTEIWELAEYFGVSENAIRWAIHYYTENKGLNFNDP